MNKFFEAQHIPYDQQATSYHTTVAERIAALAPSNGSVLDVGCGNGAMLGLLGKIRPDLSLTGLDGDPECLRAAGELLGDGAELVLHSADVKMTGSYDVVTSSHVAEHVESPVDFVRDMTGVAKPAGFVVLAVPNLITPVRVLNAMFQRDRTNPGHVCGWDYGHFKLFLARAGLKNVEFDYDSVPIIPGRFRDRWSPADTASRRLASVVPRLSETLIATAQVPMDRVELPTS